MLARDLQQLRQSGNDNHGSLACSNQRRSIMPPGGASSQRLRKSLNSVGANTHVEAAACRIRTRRSCVPIAKPPDIAARTCRPQITTNSSYTTNGATTVTSAP